MTNVPDVVGKPEPSRLWRLRLTVQQAALDALADRARVLAAEAERQLIRPSSLRDGRRRTEPRTAYRTTAHVGRPVAELPTTTEEPSP